jgi:hypothetical protein
MAMIMIMLARMARVRKIRFTAQAPGAKKLQVDTQRIRAAEELSAFLCGPVV